MRAKKSHHAVGVITLISVIAIAVATTAMVVVMSIFNGFEQLAEKQLAYIDPDLKVTRQQGAPFPMADSLSALIATIPGVSGTTPMVTTRALLESPSGQTPVVIHAVNPHFPLLAPIDSAIIDGQFATEINSPNPEVVPATIAIGVANALTQAPDPNTTLTLYVPRRTGRINPAAPQKAFRSAPVAVSGVFRINQADYDADVIIIPLETGRQLLQFTTQAHAIEVFLDRGQNPKAIATEIKRLLPEGFVVSNRMEQHPEAFRMIAIEKWITLLMLTFILTIALFNIISSLSILVIEKRYDMQTLHALGAPPALTSRIFMAEGWLITAVGTGTGTLLGVALVLIQQHTGIITLNADASQLSIPAYPVALKLSDLILVIIIATITGALASLASRIFTRKTSPNQ